MDKHIYKVRITTTEPVLGTQPQKDVASEYITSKFAERVEKNGIAANDAGLPEDELASLSESLEKGTTVFHRLSGVPIYYDYHIKGMLKNSAMIQNPMDGVRNLRSKVDNLIFVHPRQIVLHVPDGAEVKYLERPLRAQTMQGPRVSLARSEMLPAGTWLDCEITVLGGVFTEAMLRKLLDYGQYCGLGQWRNASYGRFTYTLEEV